MTSFFLMEKDITEDDFAVYLHWHTANITSFVE